MSGGERWVRAAAAAIAAALAVGFGCSAIVSQDAAQCASDADCARFPGTTCVQGGCVARASTFDAGIDLDRPCSSNQDCIPLHGSDSVCRNNACLDLVNDDCGLVLGHHTSDDSLILGAIVPYGTRHASAGLAIEHALELAVQDDFAGGVPFGGGASEPTDGGAPRHPLAVVLCDETRDPKREALHLVNDVHVPVIFGPAFGESVLDVASVTNPAGVMLVSPYTTADLGDASSDLVWRTSPTSDGEAAAMADVIAQVVAPRVASARGHSAQIAIAWSTDPDGAALHARLAPLLASDAAPIIDASCGDPDVAGADRSADAIAQMTGATLPDVVAVIGRVAAVTEVIKALEGMSWPQSGVPRPYYVVSHGAALSELLDLAALKSDLRSRLLVTAPGDVESENAPLRELRVRFTQRYDDVPVDTYGVAQGFDAYYLIAFGIARARNRDVSGDDVVAGLQSILFGASPQPIDLTPESIDDAFVRIVRGQALALHGTSGELAFDASTRTPPSDVPVSCIAPNGARAFAPAGLVWRASSGALEGQLASVCTLQ